MAGSKCIHNTYGPGGGGGGGFMPKISVILFLVLGGGVLPKFSFMLNGFGLNRAYSPGFCTS